MKFCVEILCVLSVIVLAEARSLPNARNGMFIYQSAPTGYYPYPQRAMYVQYGGHQAYRANRRSTEEGGVAAFAAGNTIAAETYLRDGQEVVQEPSAVRYDHDDEEHVHSIAEAYPEPEQIPLFIPNERVVPTVQLEEEQVNEVEPQPELVLEPVPEVKLEEPIVLVDRREKEYVPPQAPPTIHEQAVKTHQVVEQKHRVNVELEDDNDSSSFLQKAAGSSNIPANSFFPIHFGSTSGGAIAIANSFSTGKGGTATSHATAYGSPAKSRNGNKRRYVAPTESH